MGCQQNGFLESDVVMLQNNFTGMRDKARELCGTKYKKHGIEKLTFLDMLAASRHNGEESPNVNAAEKLAAWSCAMGDLGCDMAMCVYSFCKKPKNQIGFYGQCEGWHPV